MRIGLCVVATGKYRRFVGPLWDSARRFFLTGHDVRLLVFSDAPPPVRCEWVATAHRPWPGPTLYRYHILLEAENRLRACHYVFYCDADMRFVAPVGEEVLGRHVAVLHPGFFAKPACEFTYERRPQSRAYVPPGAGTHYYAGGFQGGRSGDFLCAAKAMRQAIDDDLRQNLVAVWHDESHWNRYCLDRPPSVVLPPTYCCPESWPMPGRKLLALDKNHAELRSP